MKDLFRHVPTTENPDIRWKDPEAWKCLTDEQRDVIDKWYKDDCLERYEDEKAKQDRHNNDEIWISLCGLIPFITWHCARLQPCTLWRYAVELVAGIAIYLAIFCVGAAIMVQVVQTHENNWWRRVLAIAGVWLTSAIILNYIG